MGSKLYNTFRVAGLTSSLTGSCHIEAGCWIRGFDLAYPATLGIEERIGPPGTPIGQDGTTCGTSYIVEAAADLIDFNVNRNAWISSNPFYKIGFVSDRLGSNEVVRQQGRVPAWRSPGHSSHFDRARDTMGRVRGTSRVDPALEEARGNIQFDQYTWIFNPFSPRPLGPTTRSQTYYRSAESSLQEYQTRLGDCDASFDARADNLLQFLDRIAADIGSTSALLMERADAHNSGWFTPKQIIYSCSPRARCTAITAFSLAHAPILPR